MCLDYVEKNVKEIFGDKDSIVCYKLVKLSEYCEDKGVKTKYAAPYRETPIYLRGENLSDRKGTNITPLERENGIEKGIHLFRKTKDLLYKMGYRFATRGYGYKYVILKAICKREDYVAHNSREIVFTKVKYTKALTKDEYFNSCKDSCFTTYL